MRRLINLVESAQYSEIASADDVARLVRSIHHSPQDFDDGDGGDLGNRIYKFTQYVLKKLPLNKIDPDEWYVDHDRVDDYVEASDFIPPIVYDADVNSIIDGIHRVNAAIRRGDHEITAYVGLTENIDPDYDPEMSEYA